MGDLAAVTYILTGATMHLTLRMALRGAQHSIRWGRRRR